jgi:hypothetical protein
LRRGRVHFRGSTGSNHERNVNSSLKDLGVLSLNGPFFLEVSQDGLEYIHVPGRETSVSLLVINSSSTGMPSLVLAMPRWIAGMMSSGLVTRSP